MKLNAAQKSALIAFGLKVSSDGFSYACSDYPIDDPELAKKICAPVQAAEGIYTELIEDNDLQDEVEM